MTKLNIKPSELPLNTIIDDLEYGKFIKETSGVWVQIHPLHRKLQDMVKDSGFSNSKNRPTHFIPDKSDEYFKEFEIVSSPVGWIHPGVDREVVYWYDLGRQHAVRKTTIHEIIEDRDDLAEEELAFAKPKPIIWRDIPGFPKYETSVNWRNEKIFVRTKKTLKHRTRRENGFFVLYENRKRVLWCEGELGTANQIEHFYKTGEVV